MVAHARIVDTLARMRRAGTITRAMHRAARDFQAHFAIAAYGATPSRDMVRVSGGGWTNDLTDNQIAARNRVARALGTLGGIGSPGGSCVWHVVGLGYSLREWAGQQGWAGRPMHHNQATGVLVAALGVLAVHYGYGAGEEATWMMHIWLEIARQHVRHGNSPHAQAQHGFARGMQKGC